MAGESQILNDPADAVEAGVSRSNDIGHTISEVHSGYWHADALRNHSLNKWKI